MLLKLFCWYSFSKTVKYLLPGEAKNNAKGSKLLFRLNMWKDLQISAQKKQ